jgi:DNA-binding response OmpR family regulator
MARLKAVPTFSMSEVRETILLMEDDSRVRQLTIKRLRLIRYQVPEASDGSAALEISNAATPSTWCSPI